MSSMRDDEEEIIVKEGHGFGFHLLKADNDLFHEEDAKPHPVINVRRTKNLDAWLLLENNVITLELKATRFTKAEKEFLQSPTGMSFLIKEYKAGTRSISKFKEKIKLCR